MAVPLIQTAFAAGEISPSLYGHVDLAKMHVAATTLRNMFVSYRGGAYSRPGTAMCLRSKQPFGGSPPRLFKYQFSNDQGYALEFGDYYMRIFANGAPVTGQAQAIAKITQSNPISITTAATGIGSAVPIQTGVTASYARGDVITLAGGADVQPGTLTVETTCVIAAVAEAPGIGYAPGDTILLGGGVYAYPATVEVYTTQVVAIELVAGGDALAPYSGPATITGTTGTGTPFTANVTMLAYGSTAHVVSIDSIVSGGNYTANPANLASEPVVCSFPSTGVIVAVKMGASEAIATVGGSYAENPLWNIFNQRSTSGVGTDATFLALMGPLTTSVASAGAYYILPFSPAAQASTTGTGSGATFTLTSVQLDPVAKEGDWVVFFGTNGGMSGLSHGAYVAKHVNGYTFTLTDVDGNPVNGGDLDPWGGQGTVAPIYEIQTPWPADTLPLVKRAQSADTMTLCHQSYPTYDLTRISLNDWQLEPVSFGARIAPPVSVHIEPTVLPDSGLTPPTLPTAYAYVVTAVDAATMEESIASPIENVTNSVDIAVTAGSHIITFPAVAGASYYNVYQAPPQYNTRPGDTGNAQPVPAGAVFSYVGSTYGVRFTNSNITPDLQQVPPLHQDPFATGQILETVVTAPGSGYTSATISITSASGTGFVGQVVVGPDSGQVLAVIIQNNGMWYQPGDVAVISGDGTGATVAIAVGPQVGTYPGVVAYFQQRLVYASTWNAPDTYWMSKPGSFKNFDSAIPVVDNDAITGTPWAEQVNGIQWLLPMPGGLVVMTGLGAWQVTGVGGSAMNPQPITTTSEQAMPQAFNGASAIVEPLKINYDIVYVQAKGCIVRDLSYNYWINIYTGSDLTQLSGHLFTSYTLQQSAWCEEPYKIAWYIRNDGTLLSLTYLKDQEVFGWARHDTLGEFMSACSVTEPPVDALYAIVARDRPGAYGGRAYYVERFDDRLWQTSEQPWCVDCALQNAMPAPAAELYANSTSGAVVFTASGAVFSAGDVGSTLRAGGGIATISAFASAESISGTWVLSPNAAIRPNDPVAGFRPQAGGSWTLTAPTSVVTGLQHLAGMTVTGLADGVVISPRVVAADGSVTLDFPASYITVGLPFGVQVQSPYIDTGQAPTSQGRRKTVTAVTVRTEASAQVQVGTNQPDGSAQIPPVLAPPWSGLQAIPDQGATYTTPGGATAQLLFTGDIRVPVTPDWNKRGQVAVQQVNPLPLQVTALVPELMEGDPPEQGYSQREDAGQQAPQQAQEGPPPDRRGRPPGPWMLR